MQDSDPTALFSYVLGKLNSQSIAYVHLIEPRTDEDSSYRQTVTANSTFGTEDGAWMKNQGSAPTAAMFRPFFSGILISADGFTHESATKAVNKGTVDAVAFGRHFIANPDLPRRLELSAPLNPYDRTTFYGGDDRGYTDYPFL
jgi:N-ethylmaleimide reductase